MHKFVFILSHQFVDHTIKEYCIYIHRFENKNSSAVVEDRFLCRHVGSNFIPTEWSENKCSDVPTQIQASSYETDIGTGQVNSGGLSMKHAAALA